VKEARQRPPGAFLDIGARRSRGPGDDLAQETPTREGNAPVGGEFLEGEGRLLQMPRRSTGRGGCREAGSAGWRGAQIRWEKNPRMRLSMMGASRKPPNRMSSSAKLGGATHEAIMGGDGGRVVDVQLGIL